MTAAARLVRRRQAAAERPRRVRVARALGLPLVAALLVAGLAGGLLRAGVPAGEGFLVGQAALQHAALMLCAFFGAVVHVERAAALKARAAWAVPLACAAGGVLLLAGQAGAASWVFVAAAAGSVAVNAVLVRRQDAPHTRLLLASALAWFVGCVRWALQGGGPADAAVLAWWFAWLVATIAAERLEMTRLMRQRPAAQPLLVALLAALALGAAFSAPLYGAALAGLALWLGAFDIARRTVRAPGLPRYMALCLLGGYAWLALAGLAWAATALGFMAWRDAALHALGLGFIFSMVMGHAPVILPAVARIKVRWDAAFYAPLALLHASLALRLIDPAWRAAGAALNAAALGLFALVMLRAALRWRAMETKLQGPPT